MTRQFFVTLVAACLIPISSVAGPDSSADDARTDPRKSSRDDRVRLECDARGAGDISIDARYESRGGRDKFSAEFEARPGGLYAAGDVIDVSVDGVSVGPMMLLQVPGGDVVGELDFDTTAGPGDADLPFPDNFPSVGDGTEVELSQFGETVLACTLQD